MAEEKKMFKVTIDNINIEVEAGTSILNASRMIGGDVVPPAMCYYSTLKGSGGKCRTCLVEVAAGSSADPRPMPKLGSKLPNQCNGWHGSEKYYK
ncbi:MAG: 2Fe-2S iron-sulfur cluster-binding protein [Puia sp.]